ncbi:hypothetical protein ACU42Y_09940 [Proteus mirabilis]
MPILPLDLHPERLYTTQKRESAFDFGVDLRLKRALTSGLKKNNCFTAMKHTA